MGYVTKWLIIEEFSIFLNHRILSEKWVGMLRIIQGETLARMFRQLRDNGITINRSRIDAGSYTKDIADTVSKNCDLIYIRANK